MINATIGAYPGYDGRIISGHISLEASDGALLFSGAASGLASLEDGKWHVHEGSTCLVETGVGGHYTPAGFDADPWTDIADYTADVTGVALLEQRLEGAEYDDIAGHVVVLHDKDGVRIGCAELATMHSVTGAIVAYPGTDGYFPGGSVIMRGHEGSNGVAFAGTLRFAPADGEGGWHVHEGFDCADASTIGGHYFVGMGNDPWSGVTYTAEGSTAEFSLDKMSEDLPFYKLYGHVVVFHEPVSGNRIACAEMGNKLSVTGQLVNYEEDSSLQGSTTLIGKAMYTGVLLQGSISGGPASSVMSYTVYEGPSCLLLGSNAVSSGALFEGTFETAADGTGSFRMDEMADDSTAFSDMKGRIVVLRKEGGDGSILGCTELAEVETVMGEVVPYPGSGTSLTGSLTMSAQKGQQGIVFTGSLAGLGFEGEGSWHIHAGYSCADVDSIGGHYYDSAVESDPWMTAANKYTSSGGIAAISTDLMLSDRRFADIYAHVAVFHANNGDKIGCAEMGVSQSITVPVNTYGDALRSNLVPSSGEFTMTGKKGYPGVLFSAQVTAPLLPDGTNGWHVHEGRSCLRPGGHLYVGMPIDPWEPVTYESKGGEIVIDENMERSEFLGFDDLFGHVVAFHLADGTIFACAELDDRTESPSTGAPTILEAVNAAPAASPLDVSYLISAVGLIMAVFMY